MDSKYFLSPLFRLVSAHGPANTDEFSMTLQAPAILDVRPAEANGSARHHEVAAWNRRAPGAAGVRPRDVFLHILALLQSCARQFLLCHHGGLASLPRLVVADSGRQFHALCRGHNPFRAWAVGALSAPAFPLHLYRNHPADFRFEHPAAARQPFRNRAAGRRDVRARPATLRGAAVGLLGRPSLHDVRAICAADGGVDPCLHRSVFLASAEAFLSLGVAVTVRHRGVAAAAGHDRHPSRRP